MRLTKTAVDAARYRGDGRSRHVLWDDLAGFGLRVFPSGAKSFIVAYRSRGRQRYVTLGAYGPLTVQQARAAARQVLAAVAWGEDPAAERDRQQEALTVKEAADRFLAEHAEAKLGTLTAVRYRSALELHVLPRLGSRRIEDVEPKDAAALHHRLRPTPIAANRVIAVLSSLFAFCESVGLSPRGSNPCRGIKRYRERKRERLLSGDELRRIGEALTVAERDGREHPSAILALRLLLLTGCRKCEILSLRWSEVDFENGALHLSEARTKEGRPKTVPLAAPALELLAGAFRQAGNPHVCPGKIEGAPFVGVDHVWWRIRERAALPELRIHDLRHAFASVGAAAGLGLPIIGALLGHSQPATTARYAHLAADPLRAAADRIAGVIAAHLKGAAASNVVPLRRNPA